MSCYAVGIGGTGARCIESLIHLCAMGMGPEKLFIVFVDPDEAHANMTRVKLLITRYLRCRMHLGVSEAGIEPKDTGFPLFRTRIETAQERGDHRAIYTWTPIGKERTLRDYFGYYALEKKHQDLCHLLYSDKEMDLKWDQGFRGRASIGAPAMANMAERLDEEPWHSMIGKIKRDLNTDSASLMIFATIFGATGASGFPVVAGILRHASEGDDENPGGWPNKAKLRIGGGLLLPYFAYNLPPDLDRQGEIYARPQQFAVNAKAALSHYAFRWQTGCPYDSIYLLGDQTLDTEGRTFGRGGSLQMNETHYIEMIAGLAGLHFYGGGHSAQRDRQGSEDRSGRRRDIELYLCGREERTDRPNTVTWEDVPNPELKARMLFFASLAFSYLSFYQPLINHHDFEKLHYLAPWEADYFSPGELRLANVNEQLNEMQQYFLSWLEWVCEIHFSTSRNLLLLDKKVLKPAREGLRNKGRVDLSDAGFRELLSRQTNPYNPVAFGYDELWQEMCRIAPGEIRCADNATGRFLRMLHTSVRRFCERNYDLSQK